MCVKKYLRRLVACNRQKFDAVIVDLQLGEQSGLILDEVHLSPSNRTAVTFAISGNDAEGAAFRKRSEFIFERPLSAKSIRSTLKPVYGLILRERRRYFRCPVSIPVLLLRRAQPEVHCNSVNISEGGMALSTSVSLEPRRKDTRSVHFARSRSAIPGGIRCLLGQAGPTRNSLPGSFPGAQICAADLAITKAGRHSSGIRCRKVP